MLRRFLRDLLADVLLDPALVVLVVIGLLAVWAISGR